MITPTDPRPVSVKRRTHGGGPRALLLHGLAASDSVWDRTVPLLPDTYEIWTARLPWRTEAIGDWGGQANLKGWLAKALEAVPGGAEVVVAHSMAANVLLDLLDQKNRGGTDAPRRFGIRALVLVSPFYRGSAEAFDWNTLSHYLNDFHLIMEEGIRVHSDGRYPADVQEAMGRRVRDQVGPYGWFRFFDLYLRTPTLQTGRITVPTLVLGGEEDFAASPDEGVALADALPDAVSRVLPGCGHFPMLEAAELFAAAVRDFIDPITGETPRRGTAPLNALELQR
ncbi:alpha/beta fold hydrolase [Streptomyces sp. NPDC058682]|uniref:alpha/beta fold hydrolase n=1 Tax=unclassified Streptomyces TaxID=2593676 RepID=UPI0022564A59|nr:alpha/beta hydrolase [Streptomyces sp. NBC_01214]MCX4807329.1 alpha/beta hydrolase [Streptomyces sp. NBC_01214]